jgi:hypothetical protein
MVAGCKTQRIGHGNHQFFVFLVIVSLLTNFYFSDLFGLLCQNLLLATGFPEDVMCIFQCFLFFNKNRGTFLEKNMFYGFDGSVSIDFNFQEDSF